MTTTPFDTDKPDTLPVDVVLALAAAFVVGSIGRSRPMHVEEVNTMLTGVHRHLVGMVSTGSQRRTNAEELVSPLRFDEKATVLNSAKQPQTPFVAIAESIHERYLVCLVCGRRFETLVRHIATSHDLSDVEYRRRFGLPGDYPMICDHYRKVRAGLARKLKLGVKKRIPPPPVPINTSEETL